jgi:hypothetical protein
MNTSLPLHLYALGFNTYNYGQAAVHIFQIYEQYNLFRTYRNLYYAKMVNNKMYHLEEIEII